MRTNIDIDDELLEKAQALVGATSKKDTVRLALETVVRLGDQQAVRQLRGRLRWEAISRPCGATCRDRRRLQRLDRLLQRCAKSCG